MTVTVFGRPRCVQCDATKRRLDKLEIPFTYVDIEQDDKALDKLLSLGYKQVPVVEVGNTHWSGYRIDLLNGLINHRKDVA